MLTLPANYNLSPCTPVLSRNVSLIQLVTATLAKRLTWPPALLSNTFFTVWWDDLSRGQTWAYHSFESCRIKSKILHMAIKGPVGYILTYFPSLMWLYQSPLLPNLQSFCLFKKTLKHAKLFPSQRLHLPCPLSETCFLVPLSPPRPLLTCVVLASTALPQEHPSSYLTEYDIPPLWLLSTWTFIYGT